MNKGVPAGQMALEYASNRAVLRKSRNSRISETWVEVPDPVDSHIAHGPTTARHRDPRVRYR